ncbi:YciI family protein [Ruegeria sp. SCPT10]|uniref:YciI family protein n=1 Tax=Ruegeria sp. SCP10 TaxID=3141377 RepID=UPI0033376C02
MFLVDMTFTDPNSIPPEKTAAHRDHMVDEYAKGNLMFGGPKSPRTGGFILSTHRDQTDLLALLQKDPLVVAGLAQFEITEFKPVMAAQTYAEVLGDELSYF